MTEKTARYPEIDAYTTGREAERLEPRGLAFILPSYVVEQQYDGLWYAGLPTGPSSAPVWTGPFESSDTACAHIASQLALRIKERLRRMLGDEQEQRRKPDPQPLAKKRARTRHPAQRKKPRTRRT